MFERISSYFRGVLAEVSRVSWPTRNEVITLTALIVLLVILVTLYIYGMDKIIELVFGVFYRLGG